MNQLLGFFWFVFFTNMSDLKVGLAAVQLSFKVEHKRKQDVREAPFFILHKPTGCLPGENEEFNIILLPVVAGLMEGLASPE